LYTEFSSLLALLKLASERNETLVYNGVLFCRGCRAGDGVPNAIKFFDILQVIGHEPFTFICVNVVGIPRMYAAF